MRTWIEIVALTILPLTVGCQSGTMRMNELRSEVGSARSENELHWRNVQAIQALTLVGDEQSRHDAAMRTSMASMNDNMGHMSRCDMTSMTGMMSQMNTLMLRHDDGMGAAQTMDDVQSLGAAHHSEMGRLLDEMDRNLDASDCSM